MSFSKHPLWRTLAAMFRGMPRSMCRRSLTSCVVALLLGGPLCAPAAHGQVFLASHPDPDVSIGSLTIRATVSESVFQIPVDVVWKVVLPPARAPEVAGLEYLDFLWPGELRGAGSPDASLAEFVRDRRLVVVNAGRLPLVSLESRPAKPLGSASFVSFVRVDGGGISAAATLIRIPWTPRLTELTGLQMEASLVKPKTWTFMEGAYTGRRASIALALHDVGSVALYRVYSERRSHVVPLADDLSQLSITFKDFTRLRIATITPASATRGLSEATEDAEVVSSVLDPSARLAPQRLEVEFGYYDVWRGIAVTLGLFVLSQLVTPWAIGFIRAMPSATARYVRLGRRPAADRISGAFLSRETIEAVTPGETTYAGLLGLCGPPSEERERLGSPADRRVAYEGRRSVPRVRVRFGWLAMFTRWETEHRRVEIELREGRVVHVDVHVRRE
jgi:hypothetical protein